MGKRKTKRPMVVTGAIEAYRELVAMKCEHLRKLLGWTVAELAAMAGMSRRSIYVTESNEAALSFDNLVAISVSLGVTPSDLLSTDVDSLPSSYEFYVSKRLGLLRELNGVSQFELSKKTGTTLSRIRKIETGEVTIGCEELVVLCDAIGVHTGQVLLPRQSK